MSPDDPIWKTLFPSPAQPAPDPLAEALAAGSLPAYLQSLPRRAIQPKAPPLQGASLKKGLDTAADFLFPRLDPSDPEATKAWAEGGVMGGMQPLTFVRYAGRPHLKSRLKAAVEAMPYGETKAKDAQGWMAQLLKGGDYSKDEFARVLQEPLEQAAREGRQLTKADVLAMGEARPVQLKETVRGAPSPKAYPRTKFSQYTTPGGSNYREVVIQLDTPERVIDPDVDEYRRLYQQVLAGEELTPARAQRLTDLRAQVGPGTARHAEGLGPDPRTYRSSHWEEPNPLVHVRMQDRAGPNGERILHVEEIQSDWHQAGREKGYTPTQPSWQRLEALKERRDRAAKEYNDLLFALGGNPLDKPPQNPRLLKLQEEWQAAQTELDGMTNAELAGSVPDAPFKDTKEWTGLALRRILDEAAQGGYDRVIWSPGSVQNQRYSLSHVADELEWRDALPNGAGPILTVFKNGEIVMQKPASPADLPGLVGKEMAERLMAADAVPSPNAAKWGERQTPVVRRVEGTQLEVGGSGMKGYYDKILPETVRSYAKKLGVEIEIAGAPVSVGGDDFMRLVGEVSEYRHGGMTLNEALDAYDLHGPRRESVKKAILRQDAGLTVESVVEEGPSYPGFQITPALRETLKRGQKLP